MEESASDLASELRTREATERRAECPNCSRGHLSLFYRVKGIPVHSCLLMTSRTEGMAYPLSLIHI